MITSSDIWKLIKDNRLSPYEVQQFNKQIADELKPYIFPYLEKLGVNPGTPERPRQFVCPVCHKGENTPPAKVWSENGSYLFKCFSCNKSLDVIGLSQKLNEFSSWYDAVADVINVCDGVLPVVQNRVRPATTKRTGTAVDPEPPSAEWIRNANVYIDECSERLWKPVGKEARDYLMITRGLEEKTLRVFNIGYDPACGGMVTIPTFVHLDDATPTPFRVKQRLLHPAIDPKTGKKQSKYRMLTGSISSCPFNDDALLHEVFTIIGEGEIDVMTIWQEAFDVCDAVTFGATHHSPNAVTWRDWLKNPEYICICGDNDDPGREADAEKLATVQQLSVIRSKINRLTDKDHVFMKSLPPGCKDWNEYHVKGGDVRALAESMFQRKV